MRHGKVALLGLLACAPQADPEPLAVEFAGCLAMPEGSSCVFEERMVLWAEEPLTITIDGTPINETPTAIQDGYRTTFSVPPHSQHLQATGQSGRWEMALIPPPAVLTDATLQTLQTALEHGSEHSGLLRNQIAIRLGASPIAQLQWLEESWAVHRGSADPYLLIRDQSLWIFFQQRRRGHLQEVEAQLHTMLSESEGYQPNLQIRLYRDHIQGLFHRDIGDYRTALEHFEHALSTAERMGQNVGSQSEEVAHMIQRMGLHPEALAMLSQPLPATPDFPCDAASRQNDYAWALMIARDAGVPAKAGDGDPVALLTPLPQALEACSARTDDHYNTWINLALAALQSGDLDQAQEALDTARQTSSRGIPWEYIVQGRISRDRGNADDAIEVFEQLLTRAEALKDPEASWIGRVELAKSFVDVGRTDDAIAALESARHRSLAHSLMVPLQIGRDRFLVGQKAALQMHISLLLAEARTEEAIAVAREWHGLLLSTLHQAHLSAGSTHRADWEMFLDGYEAIRQESEALSARWDVLPSELPALKARLAVLDREATALMDHHFAALSRYSPRQYREPASGELQLLYFELNDGWMGAAIDHHGVVLEALGEAPSDAELLEPFSEQILRANQITILPSDIAQHRDLHATLFQDRLLIEHAPVRYSLDLDARLSDATSSKPLVVADPRGDLRGARKEGLRVAELLPQAHLLSTTQATRDAIYSALPGASLLHFAGHGQLDEAPLSGRLLTREQQISLADILALQRPPHQVVLTSCETAQTGSTDVERPGIAHAFLIAGSEVVIAASRPLDDGIGETFAAALYAEGLPITDAHFQRAMLATRTTHPEADWAALRMLIP